MHDIVGNGHTPAQTPLFFSWECDTFRGFVLVTADGTVSLHWDAAEPREPERFRLTPDFRLTRKPSSPQYVSDRDVEALSRTIREAVLQRLADVIKSDLGSVDLHKLPPTVKSAVVTVSPSGNVTVVPRPVCATLSLLADDREIAQVSEQLLNAAAEAGVLLVSPRAW